MRRYPRDPVVVKQVSLALIPLSTMRDTNLAETVDDAAERLAVEPAKRRAQNSVKQALM